MSTSSVAEHGLFQPHHLMAIELLFNRVLDLGDESEKLQDYGIHCYQGKLSDNVHRPNHMTIADEFLIFDKKFIVLKSGFVQIEELTQENIFHLGLMLDFTEFMKYCIASTVLQKFKDNGVRFNLSMCRNYASFMQHCIKLCNSRTSHTS